jgi:flagellar basal body rod protein FlgG
MNISTAAALSGVQTSRLRTDVSANDIANINTSGYAQSTVNQTSMQPAGTQVAAITKTPNDSATLSNTDLATEMVELNTNKNTLSANLAVLKTQDKMTGELIDLFA